MWRILQLSFCYKNHGSRIETGMPAVLVCSSSSTQPGPTEPTPQPASATRDGAPAQGKARAKIKTKALTACAPRRRSAADMISTSRGHKAASVTRPATSPASLQRRQRRRILCSQNSVLFFCITSQKEFSILAGLTRYARLSDFPITKPLSRMMQPD